MNEGFTFPDGELLSEEYYTYVQQYIKDNILNKIKIYHTAGCMAGTRCDRGACDCEAIIKMIKEANNDPR